MAGQRWEWDGVVFEMLAPVVPGEKENDNSCVLRVGAQGGRVLLTGDIEVEGERQLLQRDAASIRSEVLIVPHHGSKTSSTEAFVEAVHPRWALIPAGYLNRFGFPHPTVMARYQAHDVNIMNSGEDGAITIQVKANAGISMPTGWRRQHRHYWTLP
jgi:competence protein ComEC